MSDNPPLGNPPLGKVEPNLIKFCSTFFKSRFCSTFFKSIGGIKGGIRVEVDSA
jgi:hypothetical protein